MNCGLASLLLLGAFATLPAVAQINYQGATPGTLSAGSPDTSVTVGIYYSVTPYNFCFGTGYGTTTPLPSTMVITGPVTNYTFTVPAAQIDAVPASAFTSGIFAVRIYAVPVTATSCGAISPSYARSELDLPTLNSLSLNSVPQQNSFASGGIRPSNLILTGQHFLPTSTVVFNASGQLSNGSLGFISPSELRSSIPAFNTSNSTALVVQVCNNGTSGATSYCTSTANLPLTNLAAAPGSASATPNMATPSETVVVKATFGTASPSVAGVPNGPVTFLGGPSSQFANLALDSTASFVLAPTATFTSPFQSEAVTRPVVADFNQDGIPDIVFFDTAPAAASDTYTPMPRIVLGITPLGSFAAPVTIHLPTAVSCLSISSAAVADFNGDGFPDLALFCDNSGAGLNNIVLTILNNGDGTFSNTAASSMVTYGASVVAGDFNNDGKQDLAINGRTDANATAYGFQVFTGNGNGTFAAGPITAVTYAAGGNYAPAQFLATDFNGDGKIDLAVLNGYSLNQSSSDPNVDIYKGLGNGTFTSTPVRVQTYGAATKRFYAVPLTAGAIPSIVEVGDPQYGSQYSTILTEVNQSTSSTIAFAGTAIGNSYSSLADAVVGDFTGDGKVDVAVLNAGTITVHDGDGSGAFLNNFPSLQFAAPASTILIGGSDENGDSYADLLLYTHSTISNNYPNLYSIYDYITAGTASASVSSTYPLGTYNFAIYDNGTDTIAPGPAHASFTVAFPTPTVTLSSNVTTTAPYGTSVQLVARLTAPAADGQVQFFDNNILVATVDLAPYYNFTFANLNYIPNAGAHTLTAHYLGNSTNNPANSNTITFTITSVTPSVSLSPSSPFSAPYGQPSQFTLQVNGGSPPPTGNVQFFDLGVAVGGPVPVVGSGNSPVATFSSTFNAGQHRVSATYLGDGNYTSVNSTATAFTITPAVPTVTVTPSPATIPYGSALSAANLTPSVSISYAPVPQGTLSYSPALTAVLPAGSNTVTVTFTPSSTNYSSAQKQTIVNVTKATPSIVWNTPAPIPQGTALSGTQLNAQAFDVNGITLPGIFYYSPISGTVLPVGPNTLNATFYPNDTTDYNVGSASVIQVVNASATSTTLMVSPNPSQFSQPVVLSSRTVLTSSGAPATGTTNFFDGTNPLGSSTANPATLQISTLVAGNHTLVANFVANSNYAASSGSAQITVAPATTFIIWNPSPASIIYGTPLTLGAQLNATAATASGAGIGGTFAYTPAAGSILPVGTQTLSTAFTPSDTTDFTTATKTATITVTKATPTLSWPIPAAVPTGTTLSATQLNASATGYNGQPLPGTFTYTPAAGTVLNTAGPVTLNVTFAPTDSVDYNSTAGSVVLQVSRAATTTTAGPTTAGPYQYNQPLQIRSTTTITNTTTPVVGTTVLYLGESLLGSDTNQPANFPLSLPVGTYYLSALFQASPSYLGSNANFPITVGRATTNIAWTPNPSSIVYGTPLTGAQLNATVSTGFEPSVAGALVYAPTLGTILPAGPQTLSASFTPSDTVDYTSASGTASIIVTKATPNLTWPTPAGVPAGTTLSRIQLNASATGYNGQPLPGTFVYTPAAGTVLNTPGTVTLNVVFTPTDTANYSAVPGSVQIVVTSAQTAITLSSSANPASYGQPLTFTATVTNTLTSPPTGTVQLFNGTTMAGTAQLSGGMATFIPAAALPAGSYNFSAVYGGDGQNASITTQSPLTEVIAAAVPSISWSPNPATIVFGTPLTNGAQLDATVSTPYASSVAGTFVYTPAAGTVLPAGPQTLSTTFTPSDTADYRSATRTVGITVTRATPSLIWATPASVPVGTTLSGAQLNASASGYNGQPLPGTFVYSPAAGMVLNTVGATTLNVVFTPADAADYTAVAGSVAIVVTSAQTAITLTSSANPASYGQPLTFTVSVTNTLSSPPTGTIQLFNGTNPAGTAQLSGGIATFTPTALPAGSYNFSASYGGDGQNIAMSTQSPLTEVVTAAVTSLSWSPNPATIVFGTPLTNGAQLNASVSTPSASTVAGNLLYAPAAGTILPAGSQTLSASFTPMDTANYTSSTRTAGITVTRGTPNLIWPTPATVPVGTTLSSAQLNASATGYNGQPLAGTFVYTPPAGTVLNTVGTITLNVVFTPTDTADYNAISGTVQIIVTSAQSAITLASSANPASFGQPLTFTVTVTNALTSPPTGTIRLFNGTTLAGTAQLSGGIATFPTAAPLAAGSYSFSAAYGGDGQNTAISTQSPLTEVVTPAVTSLSWVPNPATIVFGTPLAVGAQLNASVSTPYASTVPGNLVYAPAAGAILSAGPQTLSATFTPTDAVNYTSATRTASITVTKATPTLTWPTPASVSAGTALGSAQLNASVTGITGQVLPGNFVYTPPAGTVLTTVGTTTLNVTFTPADTADYNPVSGSVQLAVTGSQTSVSLSSSANPATFGQPLTLTASVGNSLGNLPSGTVRFFNGTTLAATVPLAGGSATFSPAGLTAGSYSFTAAYGGDSNNAAGSTQAALTQVVSPAATTLAWLPNPATIVFGTPLLSGGELDATVSTPYASNIAGNIVYTPAAGAILTAGQQTLSATFTPTDSIDFTATTRTVGITVTKATPTLTWSTPASVPAGTALSGTQLNAQAVGYNGQTLPGSFVYNPAAGTVLNTVGTTTLNVTFTPTDVNDYLPATRSVAVVVTAARTTVALASSSNPLTYNQPLTLTATVTSALQASLTGSVSFFNGTTLAGTSPVVNGVATLTVPTLSVGSYNFSASYSGDGQNTTGSTAAPLVQVVSTAASTLAWTPAPASIVYGTPLALGAQLNATSSIPGTFVYTPAPGAILGAGTQPLSATFTPTDQVNYKTATVTSSITVTRAAPKLAWATPAGVVVGSTLTSTQLNAAAADYTGAAALPGTFVYTPPAGTVVTAALQNLAVVFTPTDAIDYTTTTATVPLSVTAVTLTSVASNTANLGDPAKTVTLTGTGFLAGAVAQVNGTAVATTFVNSTTLTAVIPASNFLLVRVLQINVVESAVNQTTASLPLTVGSSFAPVTLTGPATVTPGSQPSLTFTLANPYPVPLTVTLTLTFTPATNLPDDPAVQFSTGGRVFTFIVPANSVVTPPILIASGTNAGTISVVTTLTAGGTNVTPPTLLPLIIAGPPAAPALLSATLSENNGVLTVVVRGFSNTRQVSGAHFHFTATPGVNLGTSDLTLDVNSIFTTWFTDPTSAQYGSTFTYTQTFNLNGDAAAVSAVSVTLVNSVGTSVGVSTP